MTYSKQQKERLYVRYKLYERCKRFKKAILLKELYKHMVNETSNHILIKV